VDDGDLCLRRVLDGSAQPELAQWRPVVTHDLNQSGMHGFGSARAVPARDDLPRAASGLAWVARVRRIQLAAEEFRVLALPPR
jgi:hypothetical protein